MSAVLDDLVTLTRLALASVVYAPPKTTPALSTYLVRQGLAEYVVTGDAARFPKRRLVLSRAGRRLMGCPNDELPSCPSCGAARGSDPLCGDCLAWNAPS